MTNWETKNLINGQGIPPQMKSKSVYKVPNGKLLKVFLQYDERQKVIMEVCITGDFFAYPEEAIELMEQELKNTVLERDILLDKINAFIHDHDIQFIGLNAEELTTGILGCLA